MYCKNCGSEINSNAVACPKCGCSTGIKIKENGGESKKGMGVALGLFLGLIGLIIGVCLYESDSFERKTFIKGWTIGFVITIVVSAIIGGIYGAVIGAALSGYSMMLI